MAVFSYRTKKDSDPKGKPRVYFTCHPMDLQSFFETIVSDIFQTHDCAIYYTPDMSESLEKENLETDLGQMNLFVVPVTRHLLTTNNRTMDTDIAYAKQSRIPILPLMMDAGLDALYSKPDKFGNLQYLSPNASDLAEISYKDKLKKYLDSVLIGDALAQRVRAAFDAYIFLSYRKKDRRYANELMKLIHKNPECRDIAIWFDEFLTPGESFVEGIQKALDNSKLFSLLVTPSLLEDVNGKPNYVAAQEYPAAQAAGKIIFPVEMQPTDHYSLAAKFAGLPDCADPKQELLFRNQLLQAIQQFAIATNNDDPEHNFLMGLAYCEGIDVEVDRMRGFELIHSAAQAGLPEAMKRLRDMYASGQTIPKSYSNAINWGEKLIAHYDETGQQTHVDRIHATIQLGNLYCDIRKHDKAIFLYEQAYDIYIHNYEPVSELAIEILRQTAYAYRFIDKARGVEIREKVYLLNVQLYGKEHMSTCNALLLLATYASEAKQYQRAVSLLEEYFPTIRSRLGATHPHTLRVMHELAFANEGVGKPERARELLEFVCENHPAENDAQKKSLSVSLGNLSSLYEKAGQRELSAEVRERSYWLLHRAYHGSSSDTCLERSMLLRYFQKHHLYTQQLAFLSKLHAEVSHAEGSDSDFALEILCDLAKTYKDMHAYSEALDTLFKVYDLLYASGTNRILSNHTSLTSILKDISQIYTLLDEPAKASFYMDKQAVLWNLNLRPYLKTNPFHSTFRLGEYYEQYGDCTKALASVEGEYAEKYKTLGATHEEVLCLLCSLALGYVYVQEHGKAITYLTQVVDLQKKYLEEDHPHLQKSLQLLSNINGQAENPPAASVAAEQLPDSIAELKKLLPTIPVDVDARTIAIQEKLYQLTCQEHGELSNDAFTELKNLAHAHSSFGNYSFAAQLLQKAHDLAVAVMGIDYTLTCGLHTPFTLELLAKYYLKSKNTEKWVETLQLRYQFCREHRDADFHGTRSALTALANAYGKTGKLKEAAQLLEGEYARQIAAGPSKDTLQWAQRLEKDPIFEHRRVMLDPLLERLTTIHYSLGNYRKVISLVEELISIRLEAYGEEHDKTILALAYQACAYASINDFETALSLFQKEYTLRVKVSGETAPKSLVSLNNLLTCHLTAGNYPTAMELAQRLYTLQREINGPQHPDTVATQQRINSIRQQLSGND